MLTNLVLIKPQTAKQPTMYGRAEQLGLGQIKYKVNENFPSQTKLPRATYNLK